MIPPREFWSDASGNQDALMECLNVLTNAVSDGPSASQPLVLIAGESGSGKTAMARQVAAKLRELDMTVLSVEKSSPLAPDNFCANLDASLVIPEGLSRRLGHVTPALGEVQLAVLNARSYNAVIVHDFEKYVFDFDSATANSNVGALIHLIRVKPPSAVLVYGTPESIKSLHFSLSEARIEHRMLTLASMPCNAKFGHFITSVALRFSLTGAERLIERLDVEELHLRSGGKVGLAVTLLTHELTEASAQQHASESISGSGIEEISDRMYQDVDEYDAVSASVINTERSRNEFDKSYQVEQGSEPGIAPVDNESFSSWVARRGSQPGQSADARLADALSQQMQEGGVDPDYAYAWDLMSKSLLTAEQESFAEHFQRITPENLPSFDQALNYCPTCFESDLRSGISPAWRVDWRRPRVCVCTKHDSPALLQRLVTPRFGLLDKAWRAFAEYLDCPASRLLLNFPLRYPMSASAIEDNSRLVDLAGRVQRWFFDLSDTSHPSSKAAEFLLAYWLQDINPSGAQGVARSYFFFRTTRQQAVTKKQLGVVSRKLNPDTASPRDTAVAFWMLGVSFDVISSEEAQFIQDSTRPFVLSFPVTRDDVASIGQLAYGRSQRAAYLILARTSLSAKEYSAIEWALNDFGKA